MARNKHPEETVNLILDVALALFFEKGYDNTSIQDIIDGLGGLTKGAVYHHFKSKEDILSAARSCRRCSRHPSPGRRWTCGPRRPPTWIR